MSASDVQRPIGFSPAEISAMINEVVVEQHAEEAAFLWTQRDRAVLAPNYKLKDLVRLDERVEAHVDGLRVAGQFGWRLCEKALEKEGAGEMFAAGVLAFESGDAERIEKVMQKAGAPPLDRALVSALGWLPFSTVEPHMKKLVGSERADVRHVGIGGFAVQRQDPGRSLVQALSDQNPRLRARALKACGELGRTNLLRDVIRSISDNDGPCRFWAAWSAARLGDRSAGILNVLREIAVAGTQYSQPALDMALRTIDLAQAKTWREQLRRHPERLRLAAIGAGVIGDPELIDDLIELMKIDAVARVAGEAFSMITGVDLAYSDLDKDPPGGFEAGPTEDPQDENVAMDRDENLRWPAPELVAKWWKDNRAKFPAGRRYLTGKEVTTESLRRVLADGTQPQRLAAALELALRTPSEALFEIRARGNIQLEKWS
jgi:uncharacterized protein (TIGR02270 family)